LGSMDAFLAQHRHLEESQVRDLGFQEATKPANDTAIEIEINSHPSSDVDTCRNNGIHAIASSAFGLS
jgi:hypothetical protein